jgi:hypothetical protein
VSSKSKEENFKEQRGMVVTVSFSFLSTCLVTLGGRGLWEVKFNQSKPDLQNPRSKWTPFNTGYIRIVRKCKRPSEKVLLDQGLSNGPVAIGEN